MPKRRSLGILEFRILRLLLEEPNYPEEMARSLDTSSGAVSICLRRMGSKSLVRSVWSAPMAVRGGKSRRMFTITGAGKMAYQATKAIFN
jgi:predicted transcriptional regulator